MKKYHFSCGNSTYGPIGLCAEVVADTKREAVSKLRTALARNLGPLGMLAIDCEHPSVEYANVYINPDYIDASEIEEWKTPPGNRKPRKSHSRDFADLAQDQP